MASITDKLARTAFGGYSFPVETHTVHGQGRKHIHEFSHSPGGAPEKLGRGLYIVTCRVLFHDKFPAYPDLYPNTMKLLRLKAEAQETADFTHPTMGTFPAFITSWVQTKNARVRSGETVDIEFTEDQETSFLVTELTSPSQGTTQSTAASLAAEVEKLKASFSRNDISVFDAIQTAANSVLAIDDTIGLYGNLVSAKLQQLGNLCAKADRMASMQDPRAWSVVNALHDLWATAVRIQKDLQNQQVDLQTYVVPQFMTVSDIAIAIYGDTSRQSDLLSLNVIANPLRVPANTQIRFYP